MRKYILLFIIAFSVITASAQQSLLTGKITDKNGQVIPFVSIYIRNSTYGTTANENGIYQFKLSPGTYNVIYRYVGYTEKIEQVTITDQDQQHDVQMADEVFSTSRVAETYRKNRDAADTIMKQVLKKRKYYIEEAASYSCAVYIKGVQRLLSVPKSMLGQEVRKTLDLDSNGRGILYQSESLSEYNFQKPNNVREISISNRMAGQNTAFGY
ncbi:MAG: carboxypeptidase-like regulatory protein [Mucilaginibacter sp.]|nr:carboxypeptidase-like regulatory protein [Mucilaginibacter sp.]